MPGAGPWPNSMSALAEPTYDVLIIGSGAAGLGLALRLPTDYRCALVCKQELSEGSTQYAQGGISAVLDAHDSLASHVADTLNAGAGLCQEPVVRQVVARGAANIRWLSQVGVPFTLDQADYHLTREGGHSHRRIVHAAESICIPATRMWRLGTASRWPGGQVAGSAIWNLCNSIRPVCTIRRQAHS